MCQLPEPSAKANDDPTLFVGQHCRDFLSCRHDQAGLDFRFSQITACGSDQHCVWTRRANFSAAFFRSIEFQQDRLLHPHTWRPSAAPFNLF
ncbi:MAG: hypothetical protein LC802_13465 [Acidobacteria bacterium]|nr:hypothetical protein [Acidobacteriota bacterium]